jgi:ferritin-like metal-binding protein YciE
MAVKTLNELFEHELKDIYYAEHRLEEALAELAEESKIREIKRAYSAHRKETQGQIKRLKLVFKTIGQAPEREVCPGIEGLLKEKKNFTKKEKPSQEILEYFNLGAAAKTERYEITAYEGLIEIARQLGMTTAVELLSQNLQEEENALEMLKSFSRQYNTAALIERPESEEGSSSSGSSSGGSSRGGGSKGSGSKGGAKGGASKSSGAKSGVAKSPSRKAGSRQNGNGSRNPVNAEPLVLTNAAMPQ